MIIKKIIETAKKLPNKTAVIDDNNSITYEELISKAVYFSAYLKQSGVKEETPIIIRCEQNISFIIILLGSLLAGGTVVPIEKTSKYNAAVDTASNLKTKYIFFEYSEKNINHIINNFSNNNMNMIQYPKSDKMSEILFTTGTTSKHPKGIIHSHITHDLTMENIFSVIKMSHDNIALIAVPLNHGFGIRRLYANLINGSTIVLTDTLLQVSCLFDKIIKHKVTSIALNPVLLKIILEYIEGKNPPPSNINKLAKQLEYLEFSSSILELDILNRIISILPNTKMYNTYGTTEAGCMTGFDNKEIVNQYGCIGKALKHSSIILVDENKNPLSEQINSLGILAFKGPILMKGYIENNNIIYIEQNYLYITNDIVTKDENGYFYIKGRVSDIIITNGLKISPYEIETVVKTVDGITDCACIGKVDKNAGQLPVLFITVSDNFYKPNLINKMRETLELYKCPRDIRIIDSIPKTFNGKTLRNELQKYL